MTEELGERFDKWLNDLEEKDPLKRFLVSGIMVILCLGLVGILVSEPYAYTGVYLLIEVGVLSNGVIPVFVVVDVVRTMFAAIMVSILMLIFFTDLEEAWLRLISA